MLIPERRMPTCNSIFSEHSADTEHEGTCTVAEWTVRLSNCPANRIEAIAMRIRKFSMWTEFKRQQQQKKSATTTNPKERKRTHIILWLQCIVFTVTGFIPTQNRSNYISLVVCRIFGLHWKPTESNNNHKERRRSYACRYLCERVSSLVSAVKVKLSQCMRLCQWLLCVCARILLLFLMIFLRCDVRLCGVAMKKKKKMCKIV